MTERTHIAPLERFLLRTPLFSFDSLSKFYELVEGKESPFNSNELLLIEEAIYLASPDLCAEWRKWRNGHLTDDTKIRRLQISLLKYFKRMCTRCTPFGLFAGCTTGSLALKTDIVLKEPQSFRRHTRLDMHYTCALAQELARHPLVSKHIKYYPNNSIYEIGDETRYVDYHYRGKRRVHQISAIQANFYVNQVLERAKGGAYIEDLIKCLTMDDVSEEDATAFIQNLRSLQLLSNDLEPSVTGSELISQIAAVLTQVRSRLNSPAEIEQLTSLEQKVISLQRKVEHLDLQLGTSLEHYGDMEKMIKPLNVPYEKSKLLQTDLFTQTNTCTLDDVTFKNVKEAIGLLNKLSPAKPQANLKMFMERFSERYDKAEIPLLEALDVETGIGYLNGKGGDESPIVQQVPIQVRVGEQKLSWNNIHSFVLRKLNEAAKNKSYEISLSEADFTRTDAVWDDTADTVAAMIKHLGYENGQPLVHLNSTGGSSAANLLGRFAHGDDNIDNLVREVTNREQKNNPDKILAEVVHLPESRTGNILMRPVFREYEIPYLAKSSVKGDKVIDVADLMVSIRNGKLVLKSKKLNKEILPHLSNAHNYRARALPTYHFLCDMQHYNRRTGFYFPFGQLQNEFKFMPRVSYKNVILSLAGWKLLKADYQELIDCPDAMLETKAAKWRSEWKMPQHVVLVDGDNELFIDFNQHWSLLVFKETIKKRPRIQLKEFGYDSENLTVRNELGQGFTNQMVLVFERLFSSDAQKTSVPQLERESKPAIDVEPVQRSFSIGSEWLYFKIYCGPKTADRIITDFILPLAEEFETKNWIDQWFFIRFSDPKKHLRVRFHLTDLNQLGKVILKFNEAIQTWIEEKQVWSLVADSYQREIERYDPAAVVRSEELFYHESKYIAKFLRLNAPYHSEETRWLFAIKMMDALLGDFGLDLASKEKLCASLKTSFAAEFGANKATRKSLATKYREHRKKIENFLSGTVNGTAYHADVYELIRNKSVESATAIADINKAIQEGRTSLTKNNLLFSYSHMLMNRVFRSNQRLHEMVLYDLLHTSYKSLIARQRKGNKTTVVKEAND